MILILLNKIIKTSRDKKIAQQILHLRVIIVMVQFQSIIEADYSAFMRKKIIKKKIVIHSKTK